MRQSMYNNKQELMWYYDITLQNNETGALKTYKFIEGPIDEAIAQAKAMYKKDCEFYSAVHLSLIHISEPTRPY